MTATPRPVRSDRATGWRRAVEDQDQFLARLRQLSPEQRSYGRRERAWRDPRSSVVELVRGFRHRIFILA